LVEFDSGFTSNGEKIQKLLPNCFREENNEKRPIETADSALLYKVVNLVDTKYEILPRSCIICHKTYNQYR
jgi:hypothetical protein